ncbi:MAG: methylated-DNA--protein-cysteine methyltransferase [Candidatus Berkelbacteria bacterium]|nr:methylated-DNA--protein-cysteine methyltransferase [Candidatus Berkelbacteria bacterium]
MKKDFTKRVLDIVARIPRGKLMTYSQIAREAGSPRAYRAVGHILNINYREREWQLPLEDFEPVPCHRVIRSDGFVGGYARGQKAKERILKLEGHIIDKNQIKLPDLK